VEPSLVSPRLFLQGRFADCLADHPKSSARYDLTVVVSRPVSIFLRVLTGFFILLGYLFRKLTPAITGGAFGTVR
jgi:hypothetical protein